MKRYVIERDVPGIGGMNSTQYRDAAKTSNSALAKLAGKASGSIPTSSTTRPSAFTSPRAKRR